MNSRLMNTEGRRARNLSTAVVAAIATLASASARSEQWQWSVTPYLWATDLGVDLTISDRELVDADIPFEDLLDKLDGATLVRVEGMHGEHGMAFDLFNVELTDSVGIELPGPSGTELAVDTEIGMTILDVTGVYDPHGDREGFSLVYGARILEQRNDVDAALRHDATTIGTRSLDATDRLVDGLVGFRYVRALPHNLSYELAADVSTGDTELTWSAGPTLGYTFGARDRYQVTAGYRRMVVDFDTAEHVDADMSMSGILVGFRIDF